MNSHDQSSVEIELIRQDIVDFNFSLLKKNGSFWILPIVGVFFLVNIIIQIAAGRHFAEYQFFVYFLLFIALLPTLIYVGARRSFDNKFLKEKKTYTFTSEGFRMESASSSVYTLWSDIKKVMNTKNAVYLFVATNAAHVFPTRFLAGHDEIMTMMKQLTPKKSRDKGKFKILKHLSIYVLIFLVTVGVVQFILSRE